MAYVRHVAMVLIAGFMAVAALLPIFVFQSRDAFAGTSLTPESLENRELETTVGTSDPILKRRPPGEVSPNYKDVSQTNFGEIILKISRLANGYETASVEDRRQAQLFLKKVDAIDRAQFRVLHETQSADGSDITTETVIHGSLRMGRAQAIMASETRIIERTIEKCASGASPTSKVQTYGIEFHPE